VSPRLLLVLLGGLAALALVPATALAAPANVTVRIEGAAQTLVPRTALRTGTEDIVKDANPGHACSGTRAIGALERATGGQWSGTWFDAFGYSVEQIRGETHVFPAPDYFALWINNRAATEGVCGATTELQDGDDVLFFVDRCEFDPITSGCSNPPVLPLALKTARTVTPGVPFSVSVVQFAADAKESPTPGATISLGGAPVATTNADGAATVTLSTAGPAVLRATKANRAPSASESVCATTGSDGACGSAAATTPAADGCVTNGADGRCATRDRSAPATAITGIREGQRFRRGKGPRRLQATVASDPSGLLTVKLRLTRSDRGHCSYLSGRFERLRRMPCDRTNVAWFAVGDREQVDYLLPRSLPRGRYVLDVNAIDKAYNRDDARRRGGNRIVFHVG